MRIADALTYLGTLNQTKTAQPLTPSQEQFAAFLKAQLEPTPIKPAPRPRSKEEEEAGL